MRLRDLLLALTVIVLWGANFPIAKIGVTQIPPLFLLSLRFAIVALLIVFVVPVPVAYLRRIALLSVTLGLVHFSAQFTGLRYVDTSTAAIAQQVQVPFAALLAAWQFGDRPGWRRIAGMALAFAGIVVIAGEPRVFASPFGLLLVLFAALMWAVASVQMKALSAAPVVALNGWMALFATPQLLLASLLLEHNQIPSLLSADWIALSAILYGAIVVTLIGYSLWYRLLRRYSLSLMMPFTLLMPIVGVVLGVALLHDALSGRFLIGACLTIFGVAVIVLARAPAVALPPRTSDVATS